MQRHTLFLWLSASIFWDDVPLPSLCVLHLRGENAENGRPHPLLDSATQLQKFYLDSLPAVQVLPELEGLPALYAMKLYELHKLSDLSALSQSHLRYFAASLIADKLSAKTLAARYNFTFKELYAFSR